MSYTPSEAIKSTLIELLEKLRDTSSLNRSDKGDIELLLYFLQKMKPLAVKDYVVTKIAPHANKIRSRNMSFIDTSSPEGIFGPLPEDRRVHFVKMFSGQEKGLEEDDKEMFFTYFEHILEIAAKTKR